MFDSLVGYQVSVAELVGTKLGLINLGAGFDSPTATNFLSGHGI